MSETQRVLEEKLGCPKLQLKQAKANLEATQRHIIELLKRVASNLESRPILLDNAVIGKVTEIEEQEYLVELNEGLTFQVLSDGWGLVAVITKLSEKLEVYNTARLAIDIPAFELKG